MFFKVSDKRGMFRQTTVKLILGKNFYIRSFDYV